MKWTLLLFCATLLAQEHGYEYRPGDSDDYKACFWTTDTAGNRTPIVLAPVYFYNRGAIPGTGFHPHDFLIGLNPRPQPLLTPIDFSHAPLGSGVTPVTDQAGCAYLHVDYQAFAGVEQIVAECCVTLRKLVTATLKIPYLDFLPDSTGMVLHSAHQDFYHFTGDRNSTFYGDNNNILGMIKVAYGYTFDTGQLLDIVRIGLGWGGSYDNGFWVTPNWEEHDLGNQYDIANPDNGGNQFSNIEFHALEAGCTKGAWLPGGPKFPPTPVSYQYWQSQPVTHYNCPVSTSLPQHPRRHQ